MAIETRREIAGHWWTPHHPGVTVPGTLTLDPEDGIRLELVSTDPHGALGSLPSVVYDQIDERQQQGLTVTGQDIAGRYYTLLDGLLGGRRFGGGGAASATLRFHRMLKGVGTDDPHSLTFSSVSARFENLAAWFGTSPFSANIDPSNPSRMATVWNRPEPEVCELGDGEQLIIRWDYQGAGIGPATQEIQMTSRPWMQVCSEDGMTLDQAMQAVARWDEFLILLMGVPTMPLEIELRSPELTREGEDGPVEVPIGLYYEPFRPRHLHRDLMPNKLLLPRWRSAERWKELARNWQWLWAEYFDLIAPYIGYLRSPPAFANDKFFGFARVAESVHARLRPEERGLDEGHVDWLQGTVVEAVRSQISGEDIGRLKMVIGNLKRPTLHQRLMGLMREFPSLAADVVGDEAQQEEFASLVKNLRNQEAHLPARKLTPGGLQLVAMASKLRVLIDAWLLRALGLEVDEVEAAMRGCPYYWFYASSKTWPWQPEASG